MFHLIVDLVKHELHHLIDSGHKDSLVILAFLEDDVLEEVHSTLKILLNADIPISDIDESSQVSILPLKVKFQVCGS